MSKFVSRSMPLLFTLTLAGAASARRPPALVDAQGRADSVYATCAESQTLSMAGYRNMLARVAPAEPSEPAAVAVSLPSRKMGDHLVLVCAGGEIHQGSGYRDFPARLRSEPAEPQIAGRTQLVGTR
jgi:hypothetical protein